MQKKVLQQHFADFPITEFWRLFIDANRSAVGPLGFDVKEPGYQKSLQAAFDFALKNITLPLTTEFLIKLHDQSVQFAKTTLVTSEKETVIYLHENFDQGLRDENSGEFGLVTTGENQNTTRKGLEELLNKIANGEKFIIDLYFTSKLTAYINSNNIPRPLTPEFIDHVYKDLCSADLTGATLTSSLRDPALIKDKMATHINSYNEAILKAESKDQKLLAIAALIHDLELLHPFIDANCRTFVLELLPLLLEQQGFPPSIVTNPNRFDLFSPEELMTEIKEGFTRFQSLKTTPSQPVAEHETDTLLYINDTTATLLALDSVRRIPHWNEVNPSERDFAIELIKKSLMTGFKKKELTFEEAQTIRATITNTVQETIYQKSFYQVSMFSQPNQYGIHFDSHLNKLLVHHRLSTDSLIDKLNEKISPNALSL